MAEETKGNNKLGFIVAMFVMAVVIAIFVPLPSFLLDALQAFNITLAMIILIMTMYTKDALEFSSFPSLLLVTTLLRLTLNTSAMRLILTQGTGFEGQLIKAFGEFVVQGDYIVGITFFIVLFIIQFMVITKGAERVAEVAARFTLDAMPGKQMSIDADYNAGLITEDEARNRRKKIQKEADFYGAMDGATKFVKGDAIAGLLIVILNFVMGLVTGVISRGESLNDALAIYPILTIGDGLSAMVPALLISVATAMIVTRSASESDFGTDLLRQFLNEPRVLYMGAGASFVIGLIPGMPKLAFFGIAGSLGFLAYTISKTVKESTTAEATAMEERSAQEEAKKPENVKDLLRVDLMELEIGYSLIPLVDTSQGGDLLERITMIRKQIAIELGIIVPPIRIRDNMQLNPNEYSVKIKGGEVSKGEVMIGYYLAMNPGNVEEEISGIPTVEPAFNLPAIWISSEQRERAEMVGYTVVDPTSVVATHITEIIKKHAQDILGREMVKELIENIKQDYAVIVDEVYPSKLDLGEIQSVLQGLLMEGISVRNLPLIMEVLADASKYTKRLETLTEYARSGLSRQICSALQGADKKLRVITLNPGLENNLKEYIQETDFGNYLALPPDLNQQVTATITEEVRRSNSFGYQPILLVTPELRKPIRRLIERELRFVSVLSYNEILPEVELEAVGMVSI